MTAKSNEGLIVFGMIALVLFVLFGGQFSTISNPASNTALYTIEPQGSGLYKVNWAGWGDQGCPMQCNFFNNGQAATLHPVPYSNGQSEQPTTITFNPDTTILQENHMIATQTCGGLMTIPVTFAGVDQTTTANGGHNYDFGTGSIGFSPGSPGFSGCTTPSRVSISGYWIINDTSFKVQIPCGGACPNGAQCVSNQCVNTANPCGGGCPSNQTCTNNQCVASQQPPVDATFVWIIVLIAIVGFVIFLWRR